MITIKNFDGDMNVAAFFGWDMQFAMEDKDFYSFEFKHRVEGKGVYVLLHRKPIVHAKPIVGDFYEVDVQDMRDKWKRTVHLAPNHLTKNSFYEIIENIIDEEYALPF